MLINFILVTTILVLFSTYFFLFKKIKELFEDKNKLYLENSLLYRDNENLARQIDELKSDNNNLLNKLEDLKKLYNGLLLESEQFRLKLRDREKTISEFSNIKEQLLGQFKVISSEVIKEQKISFSEQQKEGLTNLLNPFKSQIDEFTRKLQETNKNSIETKVSMEEQIKNLIEQSKNIGDKADNLAEVLSNNRKIQGNWGEMTLRNIFESVGFVNGIDYIEQDRTKDEDGKTFIPDFIVNLPQERKIIIDAKVSIVNYQEYINSKNNYDRIEYMKKYCQDIRNHLKELSSKEYQKLYAKSSDFVFMYLPLESAYFVAIKNDKKLMEEATERKINIVTASTIIPILETIKSFRNFERQNKSIEKIVYLANRLCEKFDKYHESMEKIRININNANSAYLDAYNYMFDGKGNLRKTTEEIGAYLGKNNLTEFIAINANTGENS